MTVKYLLRQWAWIHRVYIYHKPYSEIGLIHQLNAIELGHHIVFLKIDPETLASFGWKLIFQPLSISDVSEDGSTPKAIGNLKEQGDLVFWVSLFSDNPI